MWKPREGAKAQEPLNVKFWKPEVPGETIIGKLEKIRRTRFDKDVAEFAPACIVPKEGTPNMFGNLAVNLNAWLEKLVHSNMVGKYLAIGYKGTKTTPQGEMRTFAVFVVSQDEFEEVGRAANKAVTQGDADDGEADDDLPF